MPYPGAQPEPLAWDVPVPLREQNAEEMVSFPSVVQLKTRNSESISAEASRFASRSSVFKNKKTGVTYCNAATQTAYAPPKNRAQFRTVRATQTGGVSRSQQTMVSVGTEMQKWDTWLDEDSTQWFDPGKRKLSEDERAKQREAAAIKLQCLARCWLARRRVRRLQRDLRIAVTLEEAESAAEASDVPAQEATASQRQPRTSSDRRANPRRAADFRLLEADVQAWHAQETKRLNDMNLSDPDRRIAKQQLVYKEAILLQEIDKLRGKAKPNEHDDVVMHNMQQFSQPKLWKLAAGKSVLVETPNTIRARDLMQIYQALTTPDVEEDVRLALLLRAKLAVSGSALPQTKELVQLLDREAALTLRGRDPDTMEGLRKRIGTLFLYLLEEPAFNPEASAIKPGQTLFTQLSREVSLQVGARY